MSQRYHLKTSEGGPVTELDVEALGPGRFAVTVSGQRRQVEFLGDDPNDAGLLIDGRSYAVAFQTGQDAVTVSLEQHRIAVRIWDELHFRLQASIPSTGLEGRQSIRAPMPGKLARVLVQKGDTVTEGQGVVVVEAMKMENLLRSPKAGVIVELVAQEGITVEAQALLAVVE